MSFFSRYVSGADVPPYGAPDEDSIVIGQQDVRGLTPEAIERLLPGVRDMRPGVFCFNTPYGVRIGAEQGEEKLLALYSDMGRALARLRGVFRRESGGSADDQLSGIVSGGGPYAGLPGVVEPGTFLHQPRRILMERGVVDIDVRAMLEKPRGRARRSGGRIHAPRPSTVEPADRDCRPRCRSQAACSRDCLRGVRMTQRSLQVSYRRLRRWCTIDPDRTDCAQTALDRA